MTVIGSKYEAVSEIQNLLMPCVHFFSLHAPEMIEHLRFAQAMAANISDQSGIFAAERDLLTFL